MDMQFYYQLAATITVCAWGKGGLRGRRLKDDGGESLEHLYKDLPVAICLVRYVID